MSYPDTRRRLAALMDRNAPGPYGLPPDTYKSLRAAQGLNDSRRRSEARAGLVQAAQRSGSIRGGGAAALSRDWARANADAEARRLGQLAGAGLQHQRGTAADLLRLGQLDLQFRQQSLDQDMLAQKLAALRQKKQNQWGALLGTGLGAGAGFFLGGPMGAMFGAGIGGEMGSAFD